MKSLIWQSVMWRPGKARFLIDMKNPLPIRPAPTARQHGPLRGRAVRQIRDVSRATPSLRHASGDTFSSRLTRASHPDRRAARTVAPLSSRSRLALANRAWLTASQVAAPIAAIVWCSTDFFGDHAKARRAKARNEAESSR